MGRDYVLAFLSARQSLQDKFRKDDNAHIENNEGKALAVGMTVGVVLALYKEQVAEFAKECVPEVEVSSPWIAAGYAIAISMPLVYGGLYSYFRSRGKLYN